MNTLLETLGAQHRSMQKLVNEIDDALARRSVPAAQEALKRLKEALVEHLALEEARFYPVLVAMAEAQADQNLRAVAGIFRQNMGVIAAGLIAFFDRFEGKPFTLEQLSGEWNRSVQLLGQRVSTEERTLLPMFERLRGSAAAQRGTSSQA